MSKETNKLRIIYIEDTLTDVKLLEGQLKKSREGQELVLKAFNTLGNAERYLLQESCDLVLLDLSLPDAHGLEGITFFRENYADLPLVVLTGNTDKTIALEAIKIGAQDYLVKGEFNTDTFLRVCKYAVERKKINTQLNKALTEVEKLNEDLNSVNARLQLTIEELQSEKQRVIDKNKKINSFISTIVHDLKNPVAAVNTLSELILCESDRLTIPHIKYLNQIQHSSSSMLDNILTIIETTRVKEDGNMGLDLVYENPYFTLNSAIDKYIVDAIQKNIIIVIGYRKDLPRVYFDKRLLTNVLSSLLENAIMYNQENSRIYIHCEKLTTSEMKVTFENRGLQLSDSDIEKIFEENYQITGEKDKKAKDKSRLDSSFGLSVMKKFVEIMGGTVGVEQKPEEKGTCFWFTLQMNSKQVIA